MSPDVESVKILKEIGESIRAARQKKSTSLRKFSESLGLSPSYYSKIERGEVLAGAKTYVSICEQLNLDHAPILTRVGRVDPEIQEIIQKMQVDAGGLFRTIGNLSSEEIAKLTKYAEELQGREKKTK